MSQDPEQSGGTVEPCRLGCRGFRDWTIEHFHADERPGVVVFHTPEQPGAMATIHEELGPYIPLVPVRAHRGADRYQRGWMVPRWYIALHGIKASDVPLLAVRYSWEEA